MTEDDCGVLSPPGWHVRIADGEERSDLLAVVEGGSSGIDVVATFLSPVFRP